MPWQVEDLLPPPMMAGTNAGVLTKEGAALLDPRGNLEPGIPLCPPEGDGDTGMIATNAVRPGTGNISAGTSDFAIIILKKPLRKVYREIDLQTTPTGRLAANVHCNNCTTDINQWVELFAEFADAAGFSIDKSDLFSMLYSKALEGEENAGGLLSYNFYAGEHIFGFDEGRPLLIRTPGSRFTLANVMRMHLFSALSTLRTGMDILTEKEHMVFDRIMGHGGFFKTPVVGQTILSAVLGMPINVMEGADAGGAWGMALLAQYMVDGKDMTLEDWIENIVFAGETGITIMASQKDIAGYEEYFRKFTQALPVEGEAIRSVVGA